MYSDITNGYVGSVSYTHLDVYKRQDACRQLFGGSLREGMECKRRKGFLCRKANIKERGEGEREKNDDDVDSDTRMRSRRLLLLQ